MRKVIMKVEGIAWSTNEFTVRGKTWNFTEEDLKTIAPQMIGKPMSAGHRGSIVGRIDESWVENNTVRYKASIFEPRNENEKEFIEKLKNGKISGVSPSFTYPLRRKHNEAKVLHGELEVIEKSEDKEGMLVKIKIPKKEIEDKLGPMDSIKEIDFGKIWFHDGSEKSKRQVEEQYCKEKYSKD